MRSLRALRAVLAPPAILRAPLAAYLWLIAWTAAFAITRLWLTILPAAGERCVDSRSTTRVCCLCVSAADRWARVPCHALHAPTTTTSFTFPTACLPTHAVPVHYPATATLPCLPPCLLLPHLHHYPSASLPTCSAPAYTACLLCDCSPFLYNACLLPACGTMPPSSPSCLPPSSPIGRRRACARDSKATPAYLPPSPCNRQIIGDAVAAGRFRRGSRGGWRGAYSLMPRGFATHWCSATLFNTLPGAYAPLLAFRGICGSDNRIPYQRCAVAHTLLRTCHVFWRSFRRLRLFAHGHRGAYA